MKGATVKLGFSRNESPVYFVKG